MRTAGNSRDHLPDIPELLVAAVPEPRPELLARVLAGLRDLPDAPPSRERPAASVTSTPHDDGAGAVLPRRRV